MVGLGVSEKGQKGHVFFELPINTRIKMFFSLLSMGQFHQYSMGSFSASSFTLILQANRVQPMAQKLGTEYHKFGIQLP